jgi:hypothetical protein
VDASVQAMVMADVPIVRHQLAMAQSIIEPCFKSLSEPGDARGYHGLGPVSQADETLVLEKLATISDALNYFSRWCQAEGATTGVRYLQHCREAADRISRLQDNKQALSSSRRLLERHLPLSSRLKFLETLEGIARESNVAFFSLEDESKPTPPSESTHCMSGKTFVLDFHVEASGKVSWAKLQRVLSSGDTVPSDAEAMQEQWRHVNTSLALAMQSTDLEAALRHKFAALQLIEDADTKYPEAAVYDSLRALELAAEALHKQQHADAVAAAVAAGRGDEDTVKGEVGKDCLVGLGVVLRQVEGLQLHFYGSLGGWGGVWNTKALLHFIGVVPKTAEAAPAPSGAGVTSTAATSTGSGGGNAGTAAAGGGGGGGVDGGASGHNVVLCLSLSSPVVVSLCTAAALQALGAGGSKGSSKGSSSSSMTTTAANALWLLPPSPVFPASATPRSARAPSCVCVCARARVRVRVDELLCAASLRCTPLSASLTRALGRHQGEPSPQRFVTLHHIETFPSPPLLRFPPRHAHAPPAPPPPSRRRARAQSVLTCVLLPPPVRRDAAASPGTPSPSSPSMLILSSAPRVAWTGV